LVQQSTLKNFMGGGSIISLNTISPPFFCLIQYLQLQLVKKMILTEYN